jgi:hypothetical protein
MQLPHSLQAPGFFNPRNLNCEMWYTKYWFFKLFLSTQLVPLRPGAAAQAAATAAVTGAVQPPPEEEAAAAEGEAMDVDKHDDILAAVEPPSEEAPKGGEVYRIPGHSAWFRWDAVHSIEQKGLPEFFAAGASVKTPAVYHAYRCAMMNQYRALAPQGKRLVVGLCTCWIQLTFAWKRPKKVKNW